MQNYRNSHKGLGLLGNDRSISRVGQGTSYIKFRLPFEFSCLFEFLFPYACITFIKILFTGQYRRIFKSFYKFIFQVYIAYHRSKSLNPFSRLSHVPPRYLISYFSALHPIPVYLFSPPNNSQSTPGMLLPQGFALAVPPYRMLLPSYRHGSLFHVSAQCHLFSEPFLVSSFKIGTPPPVHPILLLLLSLDGANHLLIHYIYSITYACQTVSSLRAGMGLLFTVTSSTESYNRHTISVQ